MWFTVPSATQNDRRDEYRVVEQFVQGIEKIGLFALSVIVACVAIMLFVSIMDRHPARRDSVTKRPHTDQSPEVNGDPEESDPGAE